MNNTDLIKKYNTTGPRYTSYPTVPYWEDSPTESEWLSEVSKIYKQHSEDGVSIYIHLPYCESLCTYCGCTTRITVNHGVETPYIDAVLKEWEIYKRHLPDGLKIREIHLGGGTPTFFSAANLERLIKGITKNCLLADDYEFGLEGHPNYTSFEQLHTLFQLGFRRISFGVQDFDPLVQDIIHRIQSFEQVKKVTDWSREIGFTSVNFDLVYGLPLQTLKSIESTMEKVAALRPDRIAFYSYAHVPWMKPGQRRFTELDLPQGELKRALYERGRKLLQDVGYLETGMDHFSLPEDPLHKAMESGKLHRNFMGYTPHTTRLIIGLGVSSIGDAWNAFAQNVKVVEEYTGLVNQEKLPLWRGHKLNQEDLVLREHILNLMCGYFTSWENENYAVDFMHQALLNLQEMESDGLVRVEGKSLYVNDPGKPFIRNICMAFDARLWRNQPEIKLFSTTV